MNNRINKVLIYIFLSFSSIFSLIFLGSHIRIEDIYNEFDKLNNAQLYDNSNYNMCVHFINVGKADCIYIKCDDNNVLIDAADKDAKNNIVEYLYRQNVTELNLVIMTHPHRDHIGQMDDIIKNFKIDTLIMSDIPPEIIPVSNTYSKMVQTIESKKLKVIFVHTGDKFILGKLKIDVLSPCKKYEKLNNNSVVVRMEYGNDSFIFTGDAEKSAEDDIINNCNNLESTVLKVGHHGSNTSSTKNFIKKINPKISVISVAHDKNKLPNKKVIKRLKKFGSKIYQTNVHGTIILRTNGDGVKVDLEKNVA